MNSACSPSSCKKPLFCPKGRELYEAMSAENPILVLSVAWAECLRKTMVSNIRKILFTRHLLRPALLSSANPEITRRIFENRDSPRFSPTSVKPQIELVSLERLEKPALVEFLKQGEIDETLRRHVPCPRLRFSGAG